MKLWCLFLFLISSAAFGTESEFPQGPIPSITPGSLCRSPDARRYQEQIPYCGRDVSTQVKAHIFDEYRSLGYKLDPRRRADYKIDHLIPLCAGGSNEEDNLWPQHVTVYNLTDPLEGVGCEKLKAGKIKQAVLVDLILNAKHDLSRAMRTLESLQRL